MIRKQTYRDTELDSCIDMLTHMRTRVSANHKAPHKAIMMLTIVEMIHANKYNSAEIIYNDELKDHYENNWFKYIQIQTPFILDVLITFDSLKSEKFVVEHSSNWLRINEDLFEFSKCEDGFYKIISCLISTYLSPFQYKHRVNFDEINPYRDDKLRSYQIAGKEKIYKMWTQKRSIMFQMPTGTGKTKLFVSIARDIFDWGASNNISIKILFLAHRMELIDQISRNLGVNYHLAHGFIDSRNQERSMFGLQIGSVMTLIRRLNKWNDKEFDIIIIDEAHHVKADSYQRILRAFPKAKVLGVTATPYRMSHESFRPEFDDIIISEPVSVFIKKKWLCDYDYYSIRPASKTQMDIDSIQRFALDGDYLDTAAAEIMDKDKIRAKIVATYKRYADGKKGIVYTITKSHNMNVCAQFKKAGYNAVAIDSDTSPEEREQLVAKFIRGEIKIICNVNIFSEGFDCPDLEFVQLARPTKSLAMFLQQIGRGLRPAKGKEKLIILDNVGLYNRFGFPSARRQWKRHFEGMTDVEHLTSEGFNISDNRTVRYFDDYEEGDEFVEKIISSTDIECNQDDNADEEPMLMELSNEENFKLYLRKLFNNDFDTVACVITSIKDQLDVCIRNKIDSKHKSVLLIENIESLELIRTHLKNDPMMREIDALKKNSLTNCLNLYIEFLKQHKSVEPEQLIQDSAISKFIPDTNVRTPSSLLEEINVFKKWGRDIPQELLDEYKKSLHQ